MTDLRGILQFLWPVRQKKALTSLVRVRCRLFPVGVNFIIVIIIIIIIIIIVTVLIRILQMPQCVYIMHLQEINNKKGFKWYRHGNIT